MVLRGFIWFPKAGSLGEDLNRISRCDLSGSWSLLIGQHQGRGPLVTAAGPYVSYGVDLSDFAAFLGLEMKHS